MTEPITFAGFASSIAANALMAMGLAETSGDTAPRDLNLAREFIGILEMLQDKTNGNLDEREAHLLAGLLTDLRLQYVNLADRAKG